MKQGYITIRDRHLTADEESDYGEIKTRCRVSRQKNALLIEYKEILDGEHDCSCALTISDGKITMIRNGAFCTTMIFEERQRHACAYHTPFGEMMLTVYTNAVFIDIDEDGGQIHLAYTLDSGGGLLSENELIITVEITEEDKYVSIGKTDS